MASGTDNYADLREQIVPKNLHAGFLVLSYVVSWVGALTTLEIINRRTSRNGWYNWFHLTAASVSMGGIAIWGMHYIGNRAIILANGDDALQINYNPGFTAASFFVPILVLLAAFILVGSNEQVRFLRLGLGGALAGLAICGMHYLGQAGIANYTCVYAVPNVVGAGVVAVVATISALTIFFVFRSMWANAWYKRGLAAVLLAGAVSGMHWLAEVGTQYRLKRDAPTVASPSRNSIVIIVIVLSIFASLMSLAFTIIAQRKMLRSANRAQHVVLAAVFFDQDGRLMVTPEGLLPSQRVTRWYIELLFDDVFDISHPVFSWIFRASCNWNAITDIIPAMKCHISQTFTTRRPRALGKSVETKQGKDDGPLIGDCSVTFRELFCIAASDLADQLEVPLENVGVLCHEVLSTGTKARPKRRSWKIHPGDIEQGSIEASSPGRGQLLLLTRRIDRREAERLQNSGFRFTEVQIVGDILARSMHINCDNLVRRLLTIRDYASESKILEPGVHLACFVIRASVGGGFDVLVRRDAKNQLPTMQLPLERLDSLHLEYLQQFDGMTISDCLKALEGKKAEPSLPEAEQTFTTQLHTTLEALRAEISDSFCDDAVLASKPVTVPCRGSDDDARPSQAQAIVFHVLAPIYFHPRCPKLEFIPLSFFKTQQRVYKNSPDHGTFARQVHREFGTILNQTLLSTQRVQRANSTLFRLGGSQGSGPMSSHGQNEQALPSPPKPSHFPVSLWRRNHPPGLHSFSELKNGPPRRASETSSENLVDMQTFGGIMVSQEVSVDVRECGDSSSSMAVGRGGTELADLDAAQLGTLGMAGKEIEDPETFADRLFSLCVERR